MKAILLAPRSAVREVLSTTDATRMLSSGSWVEVGTVKPLNRNAVKQRNLRRRRSDAGMKRLTAYLPLPVFSELEAIKRPGEDNAALILRLLRLAQLVG